MGGAKFFVAIVIPGLLAGPASACADAPAANPSPAAVKQFTLQESHAIAEDFMKRKAASAFDGIPETLKLTAVSTTANHPQRLTFVFELDSRHAGYGDGMEQMLAQVITHHRAVVVVEQGEVISAEIDDRWDMLQQESL